MTVLTCQLIAAILAVFDPVLNGDGRNAFAVVATPVVFFLATAAESVLKLGQGADGALARVPALNVSLSIPRVTAFVGKEVATFN